MITGSSVSKIPIRLGYRKWLLQGFGLMALSLTFCVISITLIYSWANPRLTWLMIDRYFLDEKTQFKSPKQDWVNLSDISPNVIQAFIAAEDNLFLSHWGFDFKSIKQARDYNREGKKVRGASTISMQVSKNVFLWHGRTFSRKVLEAGFTFLIETIWTKKRIMEVYLNIVELGPAIYGVETASNIYFIKSASKLTASNASLLATILPNPLYRNPTKPSGYMLRYQQTILGKMKDIGPVNQLNVKKKPKPIPQKRKK